MLYHCANRLPLLLHTPFLLDAGSNLAGVVSSGAEASADTGSSEAPAEPAAAARRITMTAANGRRYTCSLPPDSATGGAAATALAAAQAVAAAESSVASGSSAGSTEAQVRAAWHD